MAKSVHGQTYISIVTSFLGNENKMLHQDNKKIRNLMFPCIFLININRFFMAIDTQKSLILIGLS